MKRKRIGMVALCATFSGLVLAPEASAQRGTGNVLLAPVDVPPGKSFTVTFDVTINPMPPGLHQVSNQGTVAISQSPPVLTDDPDTAQPNDPTLTQVFVPTPTPTPTSTPIPTATSTPTATATSTPTAVATATPPALCGRPDGCFRWDLLEMDPSVPGELRFRWRLTNTCTSALAKADFRFLHDGLVIGADGDTYMAPSGRTYRVDIIGKPNPGVNYFPIGAGLPAGESEIFEFRVVASSVHAGDDLWNRAFTVSGENGEIQLREELCFTLPVPRLGPSPGASVLTQLLALLAASLLVGLRLLRRPARGERRERT